MNKETDIIGSIIKRLQELDWESSPYHFMNQRLSGHTFSQSLIEISLLNVATNLLIQYKMIKRT
jgi:hypothetical protein